jgi:hypothetical protein
MKSTIRQTRKASPAQFPELEEMLCVLVAAAKNIKHAMAAIIKQERSTLL